MLCYNDFMIRNNLYKIWLITGFAIVVLTVVLTVLFNLSAQKDCASCGMAAVGLVPFWLLSYLVLLINSIVIPIYNLRHKTSFNFISILSWVYFIVSLLAIIWTTLLSIDII